MNIVIRADASNYIGSGHIMRCIVLAANLIKKGHQVSFTCRPQQGDLIDFIRQKKFEVKELICPNKWKIPKDSSDYAAWLQVPWQDDAESLIKQCEQTDLIIVDHYGLNAEWELYIKKQLSCKVFAIDDLVREHHADVILDQTLLRDASEYKRLTPEQVILAGCDFALLNPYFSNCRPKALLSKNLPIQPRVLLSMGGIDQPNATLHSLEALALMTINKPFVTVLLSSKAPHYESVVNFCTLNKNWVKHIDFVENMAELMLNNDIAIGAPGTTSWERACLGLPSLIVPLAENQKTISERLLQVGAAIQIPLNNIKTDLLASYNKLLSQWNRMTSINLSLCDGLGLFRVTDYIDNINNRVSNSVTLKPATELNIRQVFDWQILAETRKYALTKDIPTWENHQQWMKAKLKHNEDYFYIIESLHLGLNIGVLRLDKREGQPYLLSIFIDPNHFGQGYAKKALKSIDSLHPNIDIQATVLTENIASQHLFTSAKYQKIAADTFIRSSLQREKT